MPTKVHMEALSPTMEEGRIVSWLKQEGDEVAEGDVLAEVETDKATMELAARGAGVLRKVMVGEGETAAVGSVIAVIAGKDEDISDIAGGDAKVEKEAPADEAPARDASDDDDADAAPDADAEEGAGGAQGEKDAEKPEAPLKEQEKRAAAPATQEGGRTKSSPLARRLAAEAGVELSGVEGSGPGGRIVRRDIEEAVRKGPAKPAQPTAPGAPRRRTPAGEEAHRDLPLTQMRKTIAKRLTQSIGPVPHFFLTREVDMGEMQRLRQRMNEALEKEGVKISVNDLVIKAVAVALTRHPFVNASWTGDAIRQFDHVHIGVAVAVDEGLITPVIRHADAKPVSEIAREVRELAGRAREKKLKPEEYTGSTFSLSNLGMFGIEEFTAVINPPEAAILAVGAVMDKPVVVDGDLEIRARMRVTLSCDHRVVDGATGAQFLQTLASYLEEPALMLA